MASVAASDVKVLKWKLIKVGSGRRLKREIGIPRQIPFSAEQIVVY